ncbi:MAG: anhydro-N-acetylmuramic acid kinase [Nitrospirae bacterium]|nr:anhydro-N-acetylmuramic acid kinase [Nitrospirota bacterium]
MQAAKQIRIIGLMSGTSHDGVDAALVEIEVCHPKRAMCHPELVSGSQTKPEKEIPKQVRNDNEAGLSGEITARLIRHIHLPYRKPLRNEIRKAFNGNTELICRLNFELGAVFANAVLSLLKESGHSPSDIDAIASHGQTIYHIPPSGGRHGSTLQIGEASVIAERTGILTISDFRTADMAAGGQGAPLVPMADYLLFRRSGKVTAILNIGGIANVTTIRDKIDETVAFDTGPGNSLIDEAMLLIFKGEKSFDRNGAFARSGRPVPKMLNELLSHPYFKKRPPKSTGRETFGAGMAKDILKRYKKFEYQDIVSTLTHLTARTIYDSIIKSRPEEIILTGGGVKNRFLTELIHGHFNDSAIRLSEISCYGIPPQAKEAVSFAILGYLSMNRKQGNVPSVTGARHGVILGKATLPSRYCTN